MNYKLLCTLYLFIFFQPLLATTQISPAELKNIISQGDKLTIEKTIAKMPTEMPYGLEDSQVDFELFYPLLSQRGFKENTYYRIVQRLIYAEPEGIEDALFKVLDHLPLFVKQRIIDFLVEQKYQPLFAYLLEMKNANSHTLEDFSFVCETLAKLGSVESTKAAIDCMKLSFADEQMIQQILNAFQNFSTDTGLDFKILKTDVLFKMLSNLSISAKQRVIGFLIEQKYQSLFTYLLEMKNANSYTLEDFSFVCETLARLGSVESTKVAIDCMKLPFANELMIWQILDAFRNLSTDIPLDFEILRKVVTPYFDNRFIKQNYCNLVDKFQVKREIPFLFENLINDLSNNYLVIFNTLFEFKLSEVSEQIRQMVEKAYQAGKIEKGIYDHVNHRFNEKLHEHEKELPMTKEQPSIFTPTPAFVKEQRRINKISKTANSLRNTDPELYIQIEIKYLTELAKLVEKYPLSQSKYFPELSKGYVRLADFVRFSQKKPQQAIIFYEEALKFFQITSRHEELELEPLMGIADIYQYALNQPQKAIEYYSRLLEQLKPMKLSREEEWAIFLWLKNWLTHEINYLQTGQPFRGEIGNNRIGQFMVLLYFLPAIVDSSFLELGPEVSLSSFNWYKPNITQKGRQSVTEKLMIFEPSHFTLLKTYLIVPLLATPEDILKYLAKHDPAGYWTAHLLGMVLFVEERKKAQLGNKREQYDLHFKFFPGLAIHSALDQPLGKAAQQYFNEHQLQVADSRLSTPQKTMQLYLQGLRNKDVETVSLCFTKSIRKFEQRFVDKASLATLKEIADSYTSVFTIIEQTEDSAIASTERRLKNGTIQPMFFDFKNKQGEWKIDIYRYPEKKP